MKITKISLTQERIKLKIPFVTALREVYFAEFVRIKVCCDDGSFACGEAPATKAITGETLKSIQADIKSIKELFYGCSAAEALALLHLQKIGSSAKAALDMAFAVLDAKEKGLLLTEYFGIKDRSAIKTDITISLGSSKQMLLDAKEALREEMDILKIKVGSNMHHAIDTTRLLSSKLPDAKLLIDANQAWSKDETLYYLEATKDCKLELLEQPVAAHEREALKQITAISKVPILADEALFSLEDAKEIVKNKQADMFNIKVMKCGGVTKAVEILEYARAEGVTCMLGSMIEGPYSINITLYLAFAYRDIVQFVDLDSPLLYEKLPSELDFVYKGALISFK